MGGGGQRYKKYKAHLTREQIMKQHQSVDGEGYLFDVEYRKLKDEEDRLQAEYERERDRYLRITNNLRDEMQNGTASQSDLARYMEVMSDRGVQLQQRQHRMQENIDNLNEERSDVQEQLNELRQNAFAGATSSYQPAQSDYSGFKSETNRTTSKIVEMTPVEYLRRATFGRNGAGTFQSLINSASPTEVEKYMRQMLRGTKYATPSINDNGRASKASTERVLAAMMNGYSKIPVMLVD